MGDFDGDGYADMLIENDEFFPAHSFPFPANDFFKQNSLIWGGNPPTFDSIGNTQLVDFLRWQISFWQNAMQTIIDPYF
jgi:hypothetical protein